MADKYYESKKRWNANNYKQINVSLSPELFKKFQTACEQSENSMRKVLIEFMASYADSPPIASHSKDNAYKTRKQRKKSLKSLLMELELIRDAEASYMENIPENLKNSERYATAEQMVENLNEIIGLLCEVFD